MSSVLVLFHFILEYLTPFSATKFWSSRLSHLKRISPHEKTRERVEKYEGRRVGGGGGAMKKETLKGM